MPKKKVLFKWLTLFLFFIVLTLAFAEIGLQSKRYVSWQKAIPFHQINHYDLGRMARDLVVEDRIENLWERDINSREHPFIPPFPVFVNLGFDDKGRMEEIFKVTPLPPSQKWHIHNFLRATTTNKDTFFRVTSNSLGFRGREYSRQKPANTYRIIVLGSYPAFGHGVNDEETYINRIERNLNQIRPRNLRYEVWNGGRQGGTGIMGLSRLLKEIPDYEPDLIVWDYGWIDFFLRKDQVVLFGEKMRIRPITDITHFIFDTCKAPQFKWSKLCHEFNRKLSALDGEAGTEGWREANRRMIEFSRKKRWPVILIRHRGVKIESSEFAKFEKPEERVFFLDTSLGLSEYKITKEDEDIFWSKSTWLDEIGFDRTTLPDKQAMFKGDAIQYGPLGHRVIGDYLTTKIVELLRDQSI